MSKLIITELTSTQNGPVEVNVREEEYGSFQLAASQYDLAMDYWANRGRIRKNHGKKFTCIIADDHKVTIELA